MVQAARRKYHYIYKITRDDGSGKYYIGMHSTDNLDDGYFGSGKRITASIKKHGKEKHIKEILEHLPTREALKLREKELVNEELLGDKLCMNIALGGSGGTNSITEATRAKMRSQAQKRQPNHYLRGEKHPQFNKKPSAEHLTKMILGNAKRWQVAREKRLANKTASVKVTVTYLKIQRQKKIVDLAKDKNPFFGKKHSEATLAKISEACKGRVCSEETKALLSQRGIGRKHSEETKIKLSTSNRNKKQQVSPETKLNIEAAKCRPCIIGGEFYRSIKDASLALGLSRSAVYRILKE